MNAVLPETQYAVQLVGPDELRLNRNKPVVPPGPRQILCRVEAVGLCFSDLKLLQQFSAHARKTAILAGIDPAVLAEIPSYVPDNAPTVPGHEAVVRVAAVGTGVTRYQPGQRFLVQTDYRWLPTRNSNASFGYNFEGALQEYVLMDERVITSPTGESMLIPVADDLSASAVALIEPWACVEDAYASRDRRRLQENGRLLVVLEPALQSPPAGATAALADLFRRYGRPGRLTWIAPAATVAPPADLPAERAARLENLPDAAFDDVLYFGAHAETAEKLFAKVAAHGLLNIVLCGRRFDRLVTAPVGRVHYGGIRLIGTSGPAPAESMEHIPPSGEIRPGDNINVIGAAGPMGVMHVVRNICQGTPQVTVFAGDVSEERRALLDRLAAPLARKHALDYHSYNPTKTKPPLAFDYVVLMAPLPALVSEALTHAAPGAIINIFAGIPADVTGQIDLNAYVDKQLYFIGTSGSVLQDMKQVLEKVERGQLDTNLSVAAVAGPEGAVPGIRAVENHTIPGKIIVYPMCKGLGLTTLDDLKKQAPSVAQALVEGLWNRQAERRLLAQYGAN